jgi:hypothetical protein
MNGFVKVKAKELLLNNTLSLFLTSATAFILKTSSLTIAVLVTHFSLVSSLLQWLLLTYDRFTVYFIYSLIIVLIWFFVALLFQGLSSVRMPYITCNQRELSLNLNTCSFS